MFIFRLEVLKAERRNICAIEYVEKHAERKFGAWLKHVSGQGCIYLREVFKSKKRFWGFINNTSFI